MLCCQRSDQFAMRGLLRAAGHDHATVRNLRECCERALDFVGIAHVDGTQFQSKRRSERLDSSEQTGPGRDPSIPKNRRSRHARRDLLKQLQPFSCDGIFVKQ